MAVARLDECEESWLSLAATIGPYRSSFISKAAAAVIVRCPKSSVSVGFELLVSALTRYDIDAARRFAWDWGYRRQDSVRIADITLHIPGEHFHVAELDRKFSTLGDVQAEIEKAGLTIGRLVKVRIRTLDGD